MTWETLTFLFQVKNIITLCNSIPKLVVEMGLVDTDVHTDSIKLATKFKMLFNKYSDCHNLMNSCGGFDNEKVTKLRKSSF